MTRYEKILHLSIDDMASFLSDIQWDSPEPGVQEMYAWLSCEYTGDKNDLLYIATDGLRKELETARRKESQEAIDEDI